MSALGDIIDQIELRLVACGLKKSGELFNFDVVPDSVIDKAFRIEARVIENNYHLGQRATEVDTIEVYTAYMLKQSPEAAWASALTDRDAIEKDIINSTAISGLGTSPILSMEGDSYAQKYLEQYLVSRIAFRCDFIKNVSA